MTVALPLDVLSSAEDHRPVSAVARPSGESAPGTQLVVRRRLLDVMDRATEHPLTVVSAPLGYGKTTLVESWLAAGTVPGPVVRIVCDDTDRLPEGFWPHLLLAVSRDAAALWPAGLSDPALPRPVRADVVDLLAERVRASDRPVVLVVDEAERLSPPVLDDLQQLLCRAAPSLRLVVVARDTPAIRPPRDAAPGSLTRLTEQDLAFTGEETRQLLDRHGVCLDDDALSVLEAATQGWPAAVRRAAVELSGSSTPQTTAHELAASRTLTDGPLADVLDAQPARVQAFLLATSVVDRAWPGLAAALSGEEDAAGLLAALVRANLFIHVSPEGGRSYSYEPMFRAMLTTRLAQRAPQAVGRLHATAAGWLEGAGRLTDAAMHRARVGEWSEAAALVVEDLRVGALVSGAGPLADLFAAMPESAAGPEASVVRAWLHAFRQGPGEIAERARAALTLADEGVLDHADALRLAVSLVEVQLAQQGSDPPGAGLEAVHTAEALIAAQPGDLVRQRPELVATLLAGKGALQLRSGDIEAAASTLAEGFEASAEGCGPARLVCASWLALTEAVRGRLGRALEWAAAAESLAQQVGPAAGSEELAVRAARAWVHTEQYAVRQAHDDLQGVSDPPQADDPVLVGALALVRARLARADGDLRAGIRTIRDVRSHAGPLPAWLEQQLWATSASLHAASGDADVARLPEPSAAPAPLDLQVEGWLRRANRALSRGETHRARSAVEQALRLAEPERMRRPFAEAPPRVRQFLASDSGLSARRQWLGPVADGAPLAGLTEEAEPRLVEPLTVKETEVLDHLSALLSTDEIAQTMFVSVNTVRSHVRSILRKLSATRRNEAVRRARDLGLLSR